MARQRGRFRRPRGADRVPAPGVDVPVLRCRCTAWLAKLTPDGTRALAVRAGVSIEGTRGSGPPPGIETYLLTCMKCGERTRWSQPTRPFGNPSPDRDRTL